ncbi:hypothetical protein PR048_032845 [Dryococelus australis]|uniref:Uncharacterized protein n=1 Tax=Dryococelus australis TaxID=614101 RepID=A0ABQ9G6J5_9NEOP|nr:hypothetical protein PR048_032845 [Dryococelus australis]
MFLSTHLGFGNIVTCAGGLYPKSNAFRTAVLYVLLNLVHGLLAVVVVFLWAGQLHLEQPLDNPLLPEVFVLTAAYNVAVFCMGALGQLWAALAFLALLCAGFASMITVLYTLIVAFPLENSGKWQWWHASGFICITGFLLGVPCWIPEYLQLVHVLDHYVVGRMVIASTILELIGFAWIYGCGALYTDFEFVLGQKLTSVWKVVWIISPVVLTVSRTHGLRLALLVW